MSVEPGGSLERALDAAAMRHPSARQVSGIGMRRVELAPPRSLPGGIVVPPVYALECVACGALFRVGSPHALAHHRGHRRPSPARLARRLYHRADRWVRALFTT